MREEPTPDGVPLSVTDIELYIGGHRGHEFSYRGVFRFSRTFWARARVATKVSCQADGAVMVTDGILETWRNGPYDADERIPASGKLDFHGWPRALFQTCELDLYLVSEPLPPLRLTPVCWDGGSSHSGRCDPPVVPIASNRAELPLTVRDLRVDPAPQFGIELEYKLQLHEVMPGDYEYVEFACMRGGAVYPGTNVHSLEPGTGRDAPISWLAGETLLLRAYYNGADHGFVAASPELCEIGFLRVRDDPGSPGGEQRTEVERVCYRAGKLYEGPCRPPLRPAKVRGSPNSGPLVVTRFQPTWNYVGDDPDGRRMTKLRFRADLTSLVEIDPHSELRAAVACRSGSTWIAGAVDVWVDDLYGLQPGESVHARSRAFGEEPFAVQPEQCRVELILHRTDRDDVPRRIARYCFTGEQPGRPC